MIKEVYYNYTKFFHIIIKNSFLLFYFQERHKDINKMLAQPSFVPYYCVLHTSFLVLFSFLQNQNTLHRASTHKISELPPLYLKSSSFCVFSCSLRLNIFLFLKFSRNFKELVFPSISIFLFLLKFHSRNKTPSFQRTIL